MRKEILSIDSMLITVFLLYLLLKISYNIFNKNDILRKQQRKNFTMLVLGEESRETEKGIFFQKERRQVLSPCLMKNMENQV